MNSLAVCEISFELQGRVKWVAQQRGFQRIRSRSPRRINKWAVGPDAVDQAITASGATFWTNGVALTVPQVTTVRLRGDMFFALTTAAASGDGFSGAVGIALVSDEAAAAGVASVPDPRSTEEADWDGWIYHRFFNVFSAGVVTQAGVSLSWSGNGAEVFRMEIDSKAMRKWSEGNSMVGVIGAVERGTATMVFHADTRQLFKLA